MLCQVQGFYEATESSFINLKDFLASFLIFFLSSLVFTSSGFARPFENLLPFPAYAGSFKVPKAHTKLYDLF